MCRDTDVLGKNADGGSRGATGKKSRTSMSFRTSVPIAIPGSRDASVAGPSKDSLPSLTGQLGRTRVQSHAESLHELKRKRSDKINLKSRSHAISSTDAHPTPNINPPFKNGKKSKKDIPYPATNAEQKRIALYHEFGGKYGSPDPDILEAFFGYGETEVAKDPKPLPPRLRDLYGYSPRSGAKVSASERSWLETAWIYVPKTPKKSTEADIEESAIVDALMPILDGLIKRLKDNNEIMAINCQNRPIETYDGGTLRPDIFIWATRDGAFMPAPRPGPGDKVSWKECHFVIEVKTERTRRLNLELPMTEVSGRPDLLQPSDWRLPGSHVVFQLGSYAREVFAAQPYRRCLPTLVLTECTAEFFLWDRAGLQYSDFFDYHKEKEKFLWIIGRLCHPETLFDGCGFDQTAKHTFYNHEPYLQINFGENDTSFLVNEALSHSYTLKSQGSVCYQGFRTGEKPNKVRYIIQDQWVSGITDPRCHMVSILRDRLAVISETKRLLDLSGVFEYYYHGVVEQRKTTLIDKRFVQGELEPDCIHRNRCYTGIEGVPNLVHSRTIWKINGGYCRTLTDFHTTLELIRALRDVVEGTISISSRAASMFISNDLFHLSLFPLVLMVLYLRHGIVHREITPWSILLHRPDGDCMEPRRGVLIDFSWSTVIDKHSGSAEARIDTTPVRAILLNAP